MCLHRTWFYATSGDWWKRTASASSSSSSWWSHASASPHVKLRAEEGESSTWKRLVGLSNLNWSTTMELQSVNWWNYKEGKLLLGYRQHISDFGDLSAGSIVRSKYRKQWRLLKNNDVAMTRRLMRVTRKEGRRASQPCFGIGSIFQQRYGHYR